MEGKPRKIIMDVDTGSDDALAIMTALLSPELEVIGICTVNGNLPVDNTTENTLRVVELSGKDVPVIRGCALPLVSSLDPLRQLRMQAHEGEDERGKVSFHEEFLPLPPSKRKPLEDTNAVCWYVDTLKKAEDKITLVMTAPLTNFACAFRADPTIIDKVEEIVLMGGGYEQRNVTSAAEFNIFKDPEAAAIVLNCGAKITMMPLDATHRAVLRPVHRDVFLSWNNPFGDFVAKEIDNIIRAYNTLQPLHEPDIAPIHDALCIMYLVDPGVIKTIRHIRCDVVCGGIADGQTVFDTRKIKDSPENVYLCLDTDEIKFAIMMTDILSRSKN